MDEVELDPHDHRDRLIWKYSLPGRWHRFKVRFMMRGKRRFMAYGLVVGVLLGAGVVVILR